VTLRQIIEHEIRARGPMPFSRYMHLCLYHPDLGYYSRAAEKFGKAGDFFTSSDVHAVFGRLLARQFDEMWRALDSPDQIELVELGPGRGLFAQDVLDWSAKKFPEFFRALHYRLAEGSPALRARIQKTLAARLAEGKASLAPADATYGASSAGKAADSTPASQTLRALPTDTPVIFFANEFFDALPVDIVTAKGELRLAEENGRLVEHVVPVSLQTLDHLHRHSVHPEDHERLEVPQAAQTVMAQVARSIERGFAVVVDYGFTRAEQLAGRHRGTLRAFRRHSVSANPYEAPGEQDLTSDVNFTALAAASEAAGMHTEKLLTQSQFLMGIGETNQFADAFEDCQLPQERAKVGLQLKHLVTPAGMGESFHVLVASRGVEADRIAGLSGLRFVRG
jgi:SAM-dependent MidA family methyltransferase